MTWRHQAACIGMGDLYADTMTVPKKVTRRLTGNEHRALAVCAGCPVRDDCLAEELQAMSEGRATVGIFGGTTREQRLDILGYSSRRAPRAGMRHGTPAGYAAHRRRPAEFGPPCPACVRANSDAAVRRRRHDNDKESA